MSQAVDQQVNLYLLEIKDAIWTAVATQGRLVNIWQNYNIYYEGYKNLYVMYESKKNIIGSIEMVIGPKKDKTITLSMIKTKEGYRKCGIGQLLVTCCVLYAIDIGYNIAVLGPITGDGIAFWPSLGLTECKKPPQRVLDKILDKQRNLANKLNCTVDPQAILVQYNPVPH